MDGVPWPKPDIVYRSLPTRLQLDEEELAGEYPLPEITGNEEKVRDKLKELGIEGELLESHIERRARSPIIGSYRILLHR